MNRNRSKGEGPASSLIGFILAFALTLLAFGLVAAGGDWPRWIVLFGILAAALAQALVHLHYFLHLGLAPESRWKLLTLLFTVWIIILFLAGSIWIMTNLKYRMM